MSISEIWGMFDNVLPIYDTVAPAGMTLPYGVLVLTKSNNTAADNKVFSVNVEGRLEVYTLGKDDNTCLAVENALNTNELPFEHDTTYLDGQKVLMEVYSFGTVTGPLEAVPTPTPEPTPDPDPTPEPDEDPEEIPEG